MVKYTLFEKVLLAVNRLRRPSFERRVAAIPHYGFSEGLAQAQRRIKELLREHDTVVVSIGGETAVGKTTLAKILEKLGGRRLGIDDYYKTGVTMEDWDRPRGFDLRLLKRHLKQLRAGRPVQKPVYSFVKRARVGYEEFQPAKLIAMEVTR